MKRALLLFFILLACKTNLFSSHIVGGEFELLHLQDFEYRLNMLLYFDEQNGLPGAKDPSVTVHFWRKSDNQFLFSLTLSLQEDSLVPYSNTDCDDGQLVTSRIVYSNTVTLPPEDFNDPEGYYVSWERCCRNYTISNVQSNDPQTNGIAAGQTFYLEFPPVVKNGEPFINSTPRLFPPLRDYGCVGKFYFVDFGGIDDDGDSLVYSLVTPYSTIEAVAIPVSPNSGPYPDVIWQDGFSLDNVMDGDPDLQISRKGLLTVTPTATGLYVFAVKCEEYRDGEKIGEMRRDFQMLVVSNCANENPQIRAREQGNSSFYKEGETLNFSFDDEDKCVEILVTDKPISGETEENVNITAIPINFDAELEGIEINTEQNVAITNELDTARFTVCFPDCPFTRNGFYQIGIVGLDDACPQPALDTVVVSINVPPPPNQNAYYANNFGGNSYNTLTRNVTESAGGSLSQDINIYDNDGDPISLEIEPLGFDLETVGMTIADPVFTDGEVNTNISWSYDCNAEDLDLSAGRDVSSGGIIRKAFDILFTAEDMDQCEWEDPQTLLVTLTIDFPDQTKPEVFRAGQRGIEEIALNHTIGEDLIIPIRAEDQDGDMLLLQGYGTDFNFEQLSTSFPSNEGPGVPGISSEFILPVDCQFDLEERNQLNIEFIVEDLDACQLTNVDTLSVTVNLVPPINTEPQLSFTSLNENRIVEDTLKIKIGESVDGRLTGVDFQPDTLLLSLLEDSEVQGYEFEEVSGFRNVAQAFTWTPDCSVFTDETYTESFRFEFLLQDNNCYDPKSDTLAFVIHVEDIDAGSEEFIPPNFFSPNGDEYNQFFGPYRRAENINGQASDLINTLPLDNCAGIFEGVKVLNRWGNVVYESNDREFKWFGKGAPAGVYFYIVKFSNREFKGSLTMMK